MTSCITLCCNFCLLCNHGNRSVTVTSSCGSGFDQQRAVTCGDAFLSPEPQVARCVLKCVITAAPRCSEVTFQYTEGGVQCV